MQSCNEMELGTADWVRELLTPEQSQLPAAGHLCRVNAATALHSAGEYWTITSAIKPLTLTGMNQSLWSGWLWNCLGWNWFLLAFERVQFKLFSWAVWKMQQFSYYVVKLESRHHLPIFWIHNLTSSWKHFLLHFLRLLLWPPAMKIQPVLSIMFLGLHISYMSHTALRRFDAHVHCRVSTASRNVWVLRQQGRRCFWKASMAL